MRTRSVQADPRRGQAQRWLAHAGLACLLPGTALSATCGTPALGAVAGAERSHWREVDAEGRTLVRERGTLQLAGLRLEGRCPNLDWSAQWTFSHGDRSYDGLTNTHAPFQSHSSLRVQRLSAQAWLPLHAGWSVGSQLLYGQIERDIAGSGNVLGYPERFRYLQALLGARYQTALNTHMRLAVSAWLGGGPGGHVRVDLPRFDTATLPLGSSRMLALAAELQGGATSGQPGWSWHSSVSYQYEKTNAGDAKTLTRFGEPAGVARQPRFDQRHLSANLGATYRF